MRLFLLFIFLSVIVISCNTSSTTTNIETIPEDTIIPQGIKRGVINVISAVTDASCKYALFVPEDSLKSYPLIVIFDPHASGNHAASQYKDLANKYKIVLAASNNIQNNMPSDRYTYYSNCIIDDVMHNTAIDSNYVYLMGFSGGARVASFLAQHENVFKGVIGCGAGLSDLINIKTSNFLYVSFAGYTDFNFLEIYKSESVIRQNLLKTHFKYFEGKHEWPPDSIMEYAFVAISLDMKTKTTDNIKSFLTREISYTKKIPIRDAWKKTMTFKAIRDLLSTNQQFQTEKSFAFNYLGGYESKAAERSLSLSLTSETKSQSEIQKSFVEKDMEWWDKKMKILNAALIKKDKTPSDYRDIRLLKYISMVGYMLTSQELKSGETLMAEKYLKIYRLADPANPDVIFFTGVYFAINKQYKTAIDTLNRALQMGFSDKNRWKSESSFIYLRDSLRFIDLENKINSMP
ncbi:MAG: hypothetical protein HY951_12330 [Bacteroidia bacterium]|nr:hypothetical protein [Bacteroidia bacterium]